jgi:hypothetical protein
MTQLKHHSVNNRKHCIGRKPLLSSKLRLSYPFEKIIPPVEYELSEISSTRGVFFTENFDTMFKINSSTELIFYHSTPPVLFSAYTLSWPIINNSYSIHSSARIFWDSCYFFNLRTAQSKQSPKRRKIAKSGTWPMSWFFNFFPPKNITKILAFFCSKYC